MFMRLAALFSVFAALSACAPGQFTPDPDGVAVAQMRNPNYADTQEERREIFRGSRGGVASR